MKYGLYLGLLAWQQLALPYQHPPGTKQLGSWNTSKGHVVFEILAQDCNCRQGLPAQQSNSVYRMTGRMPPRATPTLLSTHHLVCYVCWACKRKHTHTV